MVALLWAHALGLPAFAWVMGYSLLHSVLEGVPLALIALIAGLVPRRRLASMLVAVGLLTASALAVHASGGAIEAHFHFFVMIAVLALYEDWLPYLAGFAYVVLHHGIGSAVDPAGVFNHADAIAHPWKWALIHGAVITAAGAANVATWRLNEDVRAEAQVAYRNARESELRLLEAQDIARIGSWEWDVRSDTVTWSESLYRLFGVDPTDFTSSHDSFFAMVEPNDRERCEGIVRQAVVDQVPWTFETRMIGADGRERIMQCRGATVDHDGDALRLSGTVQDISELREVTRMKDEFTSVVSHELRTPLTSIRGSLGLLASGVLGPLPEKGQRMLDIAVSNTDRLVRLINDILDIERIESGKVTVEKREADAAELMIQAEELMRGMAAQAGVTLAVSPVTAELWVDPDRIMQTLTNLLSNALKFSPAGATVTLTAERRGNEVLFSVRDEGRGIPADKLESIFERFHQLDSADSREKGGTGLGLAICRSIVEQHHDGRIWAESAPGEGATLSFTLPTVAVPELEARPASAGPTVLVCDDDESVREVVAAMLSEHGYRAILAATGEQALALAVSERPAAIMLDLLMPGMSGWETAAALCRRPETEAIPVVITSVLSARDAGVPGDAAVDWIEKPIDEAGLFRVLESAVRPGEVPRVLIV